MVCWVRGARPHWITPAGPSWESERNSTLKVVELLVNRGASLTAKNKNGETALDMAIKNDKKSIAAYLRGMECR